jgi:hypothetical protein
MIVLLSGVPALLIIILSHISLQPPLGWQLIRAANIFVINDAGCNHMMGL